MRDESEALQEKMRCAAPQQEAGCLNMTDLEKKIAAAAAAEAAYVADTANKPSWIWFKEKMRSAAQQETGCLGNGAKVERDNFRARLQQTQDRAERDVRTMHFRGELLYLLDRNPEVARILELIDALA